MASVIRPDGNLLNIKGAVEIDGALVVYDETTLNSKVNIDVSGSYTPTLGIEDLNAPVFGSAAFNINGGIHIMGNIYVHGHIVAVGDVHTLGQLPEAEITYGPYGMQLLADPNNPDPNNDGIITGGDAEAAGQGLLDGGSADVTGGTYDGGDA